MDTPSSYQGKLLIAALLGAVGGGLAIAVATNAIPRLVGRVLSQFMESMSAQMGDENCNPADI